MKQLFLNVEKANIPHGIFLVCSTINWFFKAKYQNLVKKGIEFHHLQDNRIRIIMRMWYRGKLSVDDFIITHELMSHTSTIVFMSMIEDRVEKLYKTLRA